MESLRNLENIVKKSPDAGLISKCRDNARKEDKSKHLGHYAYHSRQTVESFISSYSGNWYLLNKAAGMLNSGGNVDENSVESSINEFRRSEGWLSTYKKKGSIRAVLGTEGYKDLRMLAREGIVMLDSIRNSSY